MALSANLLPGDELLSPVGLPYDTLQEVIGIRPSPCSLAEYGVTYRQADLKPDGGSFSYEDPYEEDGLTVYTAYDQDGNLTGLTAGPAPVKDAG